MPLDLPLDVLQHILAQADTSAATLYSIIRVSRSFFIEAQPTLYKRIVFNPLPDGNGGDAFPFASLECFHNTITDARNVHLAHYVQHFSLAPRSSTLTSEVVEQIDSVLRLLKNLKSFEFYHPRLSSVCCIFVVMKSRQPPFSLEHFVWHHAVRGAKNYDLLSFIESQPLLTRLEVPFLGRTTVLRPARPHALRFLRMLHTSVEFLECLPVIDSLEIFRFSRTVNMSLEGRSRLTRPLSSARAISSDSPSFVIIALLDVTPKLEFLEMLSFTHFTPIFPSTILCEQSLRCLRLGGIYQDPDMSALQPFFETFPSLRFIDYQYTMSSHDGGPTVNVNNTFQRLYRDAQSSIAIEQPYQSVCERWEEFLDEAEPYACLAPQRIQARA